MKNNNIIKKRIVKAYDILKSGKPEVFRDPLYTVLSGLYDDFAEYSVFSCANFFQATGELDLVKVFADAFLEKGDFEVIKVNKKVYGRFQELAEDIIQHLSEADLLKTDYNHCEIIVDDLLARNNSETAKQQGEVMLFNRLIQK